jgi:hypothetical protein
VISKRLRLTLMVGGRPHLMPRSGLEATGAEMADANGINSVNATRVKTWALAMCERTNIGFSLLSLGYYRHHRELWSAEAHVFESQ